MRRSAQVHSCSSLDRYYARLWTCSVLKWPINVYSHLHCDWTSENPEDKNLETIQLQFLSLFFFFTPSGSCEFFHLFTKVFDENVIVGAQSLNKYSSFSDYKRICVGAAVAPVCSRAGPPRS